MGDMMSNKEDMQEALDELKGAYQRVLDEIEEINQVEVISIDDSEYLNFLYGEKDSLREQILMAQNLMVLM
jgi:hypothetical protein